MNKKKSITILIVIILIILTIIYIKKENNVEVVSENEVLKEEVESLLQTYQENRDDNASFTYKDISEDTTIEVTYNKDNQTYTYHGKYLTTDDKTQEIDYTYDIKNGTSNITKYEIDGKEQTNKLEELEQSIPDETEFIENANTTTDLCLAIFQTEEITKKNEIYSTNITTEGVKTTCELDSENNTLTRITTINKNNETSRIVSYENK